MIKGIYEKLTANLLLTGRRLDVFPPRSGTRKSYLSFLFLLNIVLEIPTRAIS